MNYLLLIPLGLVLVAFIYIFNFGGSREGRDERGYVIRLQMTSVMYAVLFLGIVIITTLNSKELITSKLALDIIFWLALLNSLIGAIFLYFKKK
ncbi:hypothetical protein [Oceanobacillus neutriphilus]|uniref:Uncharacterized protein n=1 Tax=Oceanobacillus neutriphilus TaxID=531815 RepID=A0ABQ2NUN2_9BACI|nr:hypothetical protein [Oceanobacillus neutriphilus]GGP10984.1 hypothetical protein GCM10011346_21280 [Oceanobacillus neutriphilus]